MRTEIIVRANDVSRKCSVNNDYVGHFAKSRIRARAEDVVFVISDTRQYRFARNTGGCVPA